MKKNRGLLSCITWSITLSAIVIGSAETVFAADNDNGYAPLGIRLNSFYVFPVLEFGIGHDDNVFRLPEENGRTTGAFVDGPVSDTIVTTVASVTVNSDWNRHSLDGKAIIELGKFDEFGGEDYSNYDLGVSGQLDVKRGSYVTGKAGLRRKDEDRSSVEDREVETGSTAQEIFGVEPTEFSAQYIGVGFEYSPARLGLAFDLDHKTLDYDDVTNTFDANVDNDDRDRSLFDARLRLSYEVMPKRSIYVEGSFDNIDYDRQLDNNGIERSSSGFKTAVGINLDLSNLLLGDVYVGYLERDYDSPAQIDINNNAIGANLKWFPSRLTSVSLGLNQSIEESTEASVSGYLSTKSRLGIKHELKRNIIISIDFDYTKNEFTQNVPGQKELEEITGYSLGGTFLISRLLSTSLKFRHESRDSDIEIQEYTNNRAVFNVRVHW